MQVRTKFNGKPYKSEHDGQQSPPPHTHKHICINWVQWRIQDLTRGVSREWNARKHLGHTPFSLDHIHFPVIIMQKGVARIGNAYFCDHRGARRLLCCSFEPVTACSLKLKWVVTSRGGFHWKPWKPLWPPLEYIWRGHVHSSAL